MRAVFHVFTQHDAHGEAVQDALSEQLQHTLLLLRLGKVDVLHYTVVNPLVFVAVLVEVGAGRHGERQLRAAGLLVGAGTDAAGLDCWLVKNSWGDKFGEGGYFRFERDRPLLAFTDAWFGIY